MQLRRNFCFMTVLAILFTASTLPAEGGGPAPRAKGRMEFLTNLFKDQEPVCELKVQEKYEFYDVDGASIEDLRRQMKENGTKWDDGKVYAALTTWDIKYNFDICSDHGVCAINSVHTNVEIVYHLPRMVDTGKTPRELVRVWDKYMARLKEHEFGHKALAVKAAGEINETLASLASFQNRTELESTAKRLVQAKLKRLNELQVQYDEETHHGASQGAVLTYRQENGQRNL